MSRPAPAIADDNRLNGQLANNNRLNLTEIDTHAICRLGRQGDEEITAAELCAETGIPLIELLPRLGRGFQRLYLS